MSGEPGGRGALDGLTKSGDRGEDLIGEVPLPVDLRVEEGSKVADVERFMGSSCHVMSFGTVPSAPR